MNEEDPSIKIRRYAIRIVLALFSLWFIHFIFTHSIVVINKNDSLSGASLFFSKVGSDKASKTGTGLHVVRTGNYVLTANKDISVSKKSFHLRMFQIKKVSLTLTPQKKTFKVATGAEKCPFGGINDMHKGILLSYASYDCRGLSSVYINAYDHRSSKKELFDGRYSTTTVQTYPYKDGLVGLVGINENSEELKDVELVFITKQTVNRLSLRNYLQDKKVDSLHLSVDGDKIYLLEDTSRKLLVFDGADTPPRVIKDGADIYGKSGDKVVQFTVQGGRIYILSARNEENHTEKLAGGNLFIYSTDGSLQKNLNVDKYISNLLGFSALGGDRLISAPIGNDGYLFRIDKDGLVQEQVLYGTEQVVSSKDSVYTLNDGHIYQYQPDGTENLVFYSQNIQVSSIQKVGDEILFDGHLTNGDNPPNLTYLLTDQSIEGKRREENYLPYSQTSLVSWMDYLGNKITFAPQLFSLSIHSVGTPTYDSDEFKDKSNEIIKELKANGFDKDKFIITPYPY